MPRLAMLLVALVFGLFVLSGCAGKLPVESSSTLYGQCATAAMNYNTCGSYDSICQSYANVFNQNYATVGACLTQCRQIFSSYSDQFFTEGCGPVNNGGSDACEENCRRLYPAN